MDGASARTSRQLHADPLVDTSFVDPTTELLDRQVAFLLKQPDDASFLIQVEPFLRALETDDRLRSYLEDVLDELVRAAQVLEAIDAELVSELVELRNDLVTLHPDADDSDAERPPSGGAPQPLAFLAYQQTLAYFDEQVAAEPELFNYKAEGGTARTLLHILQAKDQQYLREEEERRTHGHQAADETADVAADRETSDDPATARSGVADKGTADGGNGGAEGLAAGARAGTHAA